jgi:hypothetical protein
MMQTNLDQLRREIVSHLDGEGFVVFKAEPRGPDLGTAAIYWDTTRYPDYREFLATAAAVGVRVITLWGREFSTLIIDDALAQLAEANVGRDERRQKERQLNAYRTYEGFTCELELSFAHEHRTYIFDQPAEWFEELETLVDELEDAIDGPPDENPLGGFYSHN